MMPIIMAALAARQSALQNSKNMHGMGGVDLNSLMPQKSPQMQVPDVNSPMLQAIKYRQPQDFSEAIYQSGLKKSPLTVGLQTGMSLFSNYMKNKMGKGFGNKNKITDNRNYDTAGVFNA